jgi:hypothetical protein
LIDHQSAGHYRRGSNHSKLVWSNDVRYLDPPFNFNHPNVAKYPPEVMGNFLLQCMAGRLGWVNLANRRLLDIGCGVRFARTIANLDLDLDCYAGVDVNAETIRWLQENLAEPKFRFAHLDAQNPMHNPNGKPLAELTALPQPCARISSANSPIRRSMKASLI